MAIKSKSTRENLLVRLISSATWLSWMQDRPKLQQHPQLPDDTKLWAALQQVSGGTWGGCVYDVELITKKLLDE